MVQGEKIVRDGAGKVPLLIAYKSNLENTFYFAKSHHIHNTATFTSIGVSHD